MMNQSQRDKLIIDHLPQVELLAKRLHRRVPQVELDDLVQAGALGLIQAVDRFDETRGFLLKTLAERRIRGAMLDYLRGIDPLPRSVRHFQKKRDALIAQVLASGGTLCHVTIAQALGVSPEKYAALSRIVTASEPISINESEFTLKLAG